MRKGDAFGLIDARLASNKEVKEETKQLCHTHHTGERLREDDNLQRRLQQISIQFSDLMSVDVRNKAARLHCVYLLAEHLEILGCPLIDIFNTITAQVGCTIEQQIVKILCND